MTSVAFCALAQMPPPEGASAGPSQEPALSSNRYLLVVDTSRSMRDRTNAIAMVVQTVFLSGMNGQMRPGDTLGVWTYNDRLYSGQFPLQLWSPDHFRTTTLRTIEFLESQTYENKSDLGAVMPDLLQLVKNSDFITVMLLTDGSSEIHGTPFDDKINKLFKEWKDQQEQIKMPMVVFLRGQRGQITDYRLNTPPWPLDSLPPPPAPKPAPVKKAEVAPTLPAKAEPPRVVPSLIVRGTNVISAETTTTEPPAKAPTQSASAVVRETPVPNPLPQPVVPATQEKTVTTPLVEPQPQSTVAQTVPPVEGQTQTELEKPVVEKAVSTNPAASAVQGTASSPSESFFHKKKVWIAGLILLAVIFSFLWLLARRPRGDSRISLITRSLDEDDKPPRI